MHRICDEKPEVWSFKVICFHRPHQDGPYFTGGAVNKLQCLVGQGKYQATESDSWHGDTFHNAFLQPILATEIQLSIDCISKVHSTFFMLPFYFFPPTMLVFPFIHTQLIPPISFFNEFQCPTAPIWHAKE